MNESLDNLLGRHIIISINGKEIIGKLIAYGENLIKIERESQCFNLKGEPAFGTCHMDINRSHISYIEYLIDE